MSDSNDQKRATMHNDQTLPCTPPRRILLLAGIVASVAITASACIGSHFTTYESFTSALNKGASCAELFDQREHFDDISTLTKVDRDLARIGCTSRDAVRSDP